MRETCSLNRTDDERTGTGVIIGYIKLYFLAKLSTVVEYLNYFIWIMKAKVWNAGARLRMNGVDWPVADCLFVDDIVLLAENEMALQRVDEFHWVCARR